MPELPEVETIVRQLAQVLPGREITRIHLGRRDIVHGDPRSLPRLLQGRRIDRVSRRAKRIVFDLKPPAQLVFHLGMTGQLLLSEISDPLQPHTHLRIGINGSNRELRFRDPRRFGGIWFLSGDAAPNGNSLKPAPTGDSPDPAPNRKTLGPLGPEPLELPSTQFRTILSRPRQIKALLLDQTTIAGLGNIYVDESLHAASIHPQTRASTLTDAQTRQLLRSIKSVLRRAIRDGVSTRLDYRRPDGTAGWFQTRHKVYNREGKPCPRCHEKIVRIQAAGRSSHVCPNCQRLIH